MIAAAPIQFGEARRRDVHVAEGRTRLAAPQKPDRRAILQAHPLFGKLGADLIDRLAACAHARTVRAGATIFQRAIPATACSRSAPARSASAATRPTARMRCST